MLLDRSHRQALRRFQQHPLRQLRRPCQRYRPHRRFHQRPCRPCQQLRRFQRRFQRRRFRRRPFRPPSIQLRPFRRAESFRFLPSRHDRPRRSPLDRPPRSLQ